VEIIANTEGINSFPWTPNVMATVQLGAPSSVTASSSQLQTGALVVTFGNAAGAPAGQSYTVEGCTNSAMTTGCVSQTSYTSGSQFTGLASGTSYYATVTAVASNGYLASTSSPTPTSTEATTQFSQPVISSVTTPSGNSGKIVVNFSGNGQTYTLIGCTNAAMTTGCVTFATYTSGSPVIGWGKNTTVYFTVTANAASGFLASFPSAQASGITN
jgi:hypothetical protein